jgi:hypothetical protein
VIDQARFNARKQNALPERHGILEELERSEKRSALQEPFEEFERNNLELLRSETFLDDEKRELTEIVFLNFSAYGNAPAFTLRTP